MWRRAEKSNQLHCWSWLSGTGRGRRGWWWGGESGAGAARQPTRCTQKRSPGPAPFRRALLKEVFTTIPPHLRSPSPPRPIASRKLRKAQRPPSARPPSGQSGESRGERRCAGSPCQQTAEETTPAPYYSHWQRPRATHETFFKLERLPRMERSHEVIMKFWASRREKSGTPCPRA